MLSAVFCVLIELTVSQLAFFSLKLVNHDIDVDHLLLDFIKKKKISLFLIKSKQKVSYILVTNFTQFECPPTHIYTGQTNHIAPLSTRQTQGD